ncbi:lactoylglutathione lyase [Vibrio parahaemolyticus]|nr:lactoylglutathione lyase [Vibrio parahaemolyticus]
MPHPIMELCTSREIVTDSKGQRVIDHFEIKVAAFEECRAFYMNALEPLGIELKWSDENAAGFGLSSEPNVRFLIEKGVSNSTYHIAFSALDKRQVTAFHEAGLSAGGKCNGKPGLRSHYAPNYYAAFLIDPEGNNVESVVYL